MQRPIGALFVLVTLAAPLRGGELHLDAIVSGRAGVADGSRGWIEGGWGKMRIGGDSSRSSEGALLGDLSLGIDWRASDRFGVVVNGVVRAEQPDAEGEAAGLTEAYAEGLVFFRQADRLRIRGGMFFLPTSQENVGPMWSSPYTISFSAINAWMAEEVRPIGVDVDYRVEGAMRVSVGGTGFVGNDTMGTLIGWRGWAMHDRLSVYEEVLPLPNLWSLREVFVFQRDGTTPFRDDLDDAIGWSGRIRAERPDVWSVQYTRLDNRGDRRRYGDEYSWETDFHHLGATFHPSARWTVAAEYLEGFTAMGPFVPVAADFSSAYVLGSIGGERWRASVRRDWMRTWEADHDPRGENNGEEAWGWTGSLFWSLPRGLRIGLELMRVTADRVSALESGAGLDVGGDSAVLELRWTWGTTAAW